MSIVLEGQNVYKLNKSDFSKNKLLKDGLIDSKQSPFLIRIIEIFGSGTISIDNKDVYVNDGDIILLNNRVDDLVLSINNDTMSLRIFSEVVEAPTPINMVVVGNNPGIHDLMNDATESNRYIVYSNIKDNIKHNYLELLVAMEDEKVDKYLFFEKQMLIGLLFSELLRHHRKIISVTDSFFPSRDIHHASRDTQAGTIFNYLVLNIQTVTLSNAAEYFGYQSNYFSRLCNVLFHQSFSKQLISIKNSLAKRMLSMTTKSIDEISYELGYKNASSFYVSFKNEVGMTPQQFKKFNN